MIFVKYLCGAFGGRYAESYAAFTAKLICIEPESFVHIECYTIVRKVRGLDAGAASSLTLFEMRLMMALRNI